jgi:gliding motility-associated-like protein
MKTFLNKIFYFLVVFVGSTLYVNAQCTTNAGEMTTTAAIMLCDNECNTVTHNGAHVLDANDILEFVLFLPSNPSQILARKSTPNICFSEIPNGQYGITYHIAARAGNDAGGIVNPGDPCMDQSSPLPVTWFTTPVAHVSQTTTSFCGKEGFLNATPPQAGLTGTWSSTVDFIPTNGGSVNNPSTDILVNTLGTHTFTWTVVNGPCVSSDNITLDFIQQPNAYAGADATTCGNEITLSGIQSVTGSVANWTGNGNFASATSFETQVTGSTFGAVTFVLRESIGPCWDEDEVTITFIQKPNPVITNTYDTVCGVNGSLNVLNTVGSGLWAAYYNNQILNGVNYANGASSSNTAVTIPGYPANEHSRTVKFVWRETNVANGVQCKDSVATYITFSEKPVALIDNDAAERCGNTIQLHAIGSEWANRRWVSPYVQNPFDDPTSPDATVTIPSPASFGDSAHVTYPFIWTVKNTGCVALDTMWVTFYQIPQANAGLDASVCGLETDLQAFWSIPASSNYNPTGVWSTIPIPYETADIENTYDPNSHVTVSVVGIWKFVFRESNANNTSCYSTDTVQIEFIEKPIINAGEDQDVCGKTTTLAAQSAGYTGMWQSNGTSMQDESSPTTTVTSAGYGTIPFVWMEYNGMCVSIDTVLITFWKKPQAVILTDVPDSTVCGLTFYNLRAEMPSTGITGYWYNTNSGVLFGDKFSNNTWVKVPHYGYYDFYWIEQSGPDLSTGFCTDTAGPLRIHFIETPIPNAGGDTLFCGKTGYLNAIPSSGTGYWSTPTEANLTFENVNDPNTYVEAAFTNNSTTPYFNVIWTEDNSNGCTGKDTIKVTFARIPSSDIIIIPPKCFGELATISAAEDTLAKYTWNFYSGILDSSENNSLGARHLNFVRWSSIDTLHRISLVAESSLGCASTITIDTVYEPPIPDFEHIIINDTCLLGKGGIIFVDTLDSNIFRWLDPDLGPEPGEAIRTVFNIPKGDYRIATTYLTPNIQHDQYYTITFGTSSCLDTLTYTVEPIGVIEAKIDLAPSMLLEELVAPEAKAIFLNQSDYDDIRKRCEWHFGDGTSPQKTCDSIVEHVYTKGGCYEPFLIVMNRDLEECRDTARLDECVYVEEKSEIEVPNAFSPNGDGVNDFFQVKAKSLKEFKGVVSNRWGQTVYEWTDWETYEAGWDGNINGSSKSAPGVYYYNIKAIGLDKLEYHYYGVLYLFRD